VSGVSPDERDREDPTAPGSSIAPRLLGEREVYVSLCFVDDLPHPAELLEAYSRWLSPQEKARGARFVFEKDRRLHLIARALVRTSLSRHSAVDPGAWQFTETAHGKPEIASPAPAAMGLRFNISHTAGLVACAVARSHDVGIDVESGERSLPIVDLARRFFSPPEADRLSALDEALRPAHFYALWTLKEAYLKARGFGLSLPLDSLRAIAEDDGALRVDLRPDVEAEADAWSFLPFRFGVRHCGAVAVRGGPNATIRARFARVVPLVSEDLLANAPLLAPPRVLSIDLG
jgi:4'-phosphopantetheinyl transferase